MKKELQKIIGFDFGIKNIGVAFGQTLTKTAKPLTTIRNKKGSIAWEEITTIIKQWEPNILIVGLPFNMDGTEQTLTQLTKKFSKELQQKFNLPVFYVDERLSTWDAKNKLGIHYKAKINKKEQDKINALSAAILIEQWINNNV